LAFVLEFGKRIAAFGLRGLIALGSVQYARKPDQHVCLLSELSQRCTNAGDLMPLGVLRQVAHHARTEVCMHVSMKRVHRLQVCGALEPRRGWLYAAVTIAPERAVQPMLGD
jgi:hypothetical protein